MRLSFYLMPRSKSVAVAQMYDGELRFHIPLIEPDKQISHISTLPIWTFALRLSNSRLSPHGKIDHFKAGN